MKRAFTLIELLVYMAIMSFIIIVAGRVFSDSTAMRVRSQNMIKSSEEIGKLANLISEDVSQMGVKAYGQGTINDYKIKVGNNVYMDPNATPPDSSSYKLFKNISASGDDLIFRKMAFGAADTSVREIKWFKRNDSIFRKCRTVEKISSANVPATECPDSVFMGNASKLQFFPSKPGLSNSPLDTLFPTSTLSEFSLQGKKNGTGSELPYGDDVYGNDIIQNGNTNTKDYLVLCLAAKTGKCMEWTFYSGETYVIEFKMPYDEADSTSTTQFLPGEDHLSVGLRKDYAKIAGAPPDVLIFPSQASERTDGLKHIEISTKEDISASVALTLSLYSPNAYRGTFRFREFKVFRKNDRAFQFDFDGNYGTEAISTASERYKQKKNAKAFKLVLEVDNRGEKAGTNSINGGMVILTPNNGISATGSGL